MTDTKQAKPLADAPPAGTPAESAPARLLRIQEAAAEVGLTPRSVRYYEELGLLMPAARSEGDYRLYDETDVERLRFIKALRDDGITPAQVASGIAITTAELNSHLFGLALTVLPGGTNNTTPLRPDLHIVNP